MNTASVALLNRVSGLSQTLAQNIVAYRDENGAFQHRQQLLKVSRLGPKAFEQCAGFLRIRGGSNPLDGSAVHPESYPVVERILAKLEQTVGSLLGNSSLLRTLKPTDYTDEQFGVPTVTDIIGELDKPGRDPRPEFKTAAFKEGVEKISDLVPEMVLEGVVTNVTNFGAFVDIGVHQDGLVHISSLTDRFVKDPREVVKAGDIVRVKVLEVDVPRKRISLTMRLDEKSRPACTQTGRAASHRQRPTETGAPSERSDRGCHGQRLRGRPVETEEISLQNAKSPERGFFMPARSGIKRPDSGYAGRLASPLADSAWQSPGFDCPYKHRAGLWFPA